MHEFLDLLLSNVQHVQFSGADVWVALPSLPGELDVPMAMEETVTLVQRIQQRKKTQRKSHKRKRTITPAHIASNTCACCMESLGGVVSVLPMCQHAFHTDCLMQVQPNCPNKVFLTQCPVCRCVITPEDLVPLFDQHVRKPSELLRVHRVAVAMRLIRGSFFRSDFLKQVADISAVRKADSFVYNVCLFNIDRALHWRKILVGTIDDAYRKNKKISIEKFVQSAISSQVSTIMRMG
jgi:hypothetical protein